LKFLQQRYAEYLRLIRTVGLCMVLSIALSACLFERTPKHMKPLSDKSKALMAEKGIKKGASMFVRVFKRESELEVWLSKPNGEYALFKTYQICSWSGQLGPKQKIGDKQAPEGFYVIRPGQMNPRSKYHLAFNIGFPNAYDKSYKRTGQHLMVHGGCESAGCYAVTDISVQEIYSLGRDAFIGGQRSFHVHAYPFRMNKESMELYKDHKWASFWKNLKPGYDMFEKYKRPPHVGVVNKRYVFFKPGSKITAGKPIPYRQKYVPTKQLVMITDAHLKR